MPYIQVPVPEEHVPKVYALLAGLQSRGEEPEPGSGLTEELVERMHGESGRTHRALLEHLAANAGRWVGSSELIGALGLAGSKGLAGVRRSFGRQGQPPLRGHQTVGVPVGPRARRDRLQDEPGGRGMGRGGRIVTVEPAGIIRPQHGPLDRINLTR